MRHECLEDRLKLDSQADLQESRSSVWHVFEDDFLPAELDQPV
jgi:hypothetical protein